MFLYNSSSAVLFNTTGCMYSSEQDKRLRCSYCRVMYVNDEQRTSLESHQTDTPNAQQPASQRSTAPASKDAALSPGGGVGCLCSPL